MSISKKQIIVALSLVMLLNVDVLGSTSGDASSQTTPQSLSNSSQSNEDSGIENACNNFLKVLSGIAKPEEKTTKKQMPEVNLKLREFVGPFFRRFSAVGIRY